MVRLLQLTICLVVIGGFFCFILFSSLPRVASAQEDREQQATQEDAGFDPEAVERRLDEIERLIDQGEANNDVDRVRSLRQEGERLLDQLEAFERSLQEEDDERDDQEDEEQELEIHRRRLELHRLELEVERMTLENEVARVEAAARLAELAHSELAIRTYALLRPAHPDDDPEESAEYLSSILGDVDPVQGRIIRLRLSQLYREMDRPDSAREVLRDLISPQ